MFEEMLNLSTLYRNFGFFVGSNLKDVIIFFYYIAINIESLKPRDKSRVTSVQISHDIGTLTRYCTLTRMPSHVADT